MATKKKAELKEVKNTPAVKAGGGGGGGGSAPIDMIIVRGKSCIASIIIDTDNFTISGYVDLNGEECPFSTTF